MNEAILSKIQKLLSLATSPNEHEAKLAAEKANEMLIRHNIKMQDIQQYESKYIRHDLAIQAKSETENKWVLSILKKHFFVEPVYSRDRRTKQTTIYLLGEETNIQVASYVYEYLMRQFYDLWREYKFQHDAPTNQKQSYYMGLYTGLNEQLSSRLEKVQTETGLILRRDPKLDEMVKDFKKSSFNVNASDQKAIDQGYEAGKSIQIKRGISSESSQSGRYLK